MDDIVCTQEDDFTFEKPRWQAHLSNGEIVLQDDNRPGLEPPQAWIRLKNYCRQNRLNVVNLSLKFRSNVIYPVPANCPGYYFVNKIAWIQGEPEQMHFLVIGYMFEDKIYVQDWKIPELAICGYSERPVEDSNSLIRWENYDNNETIPLAEA